MPRKKLPRNHCLNCGKICDRLSKIYCDNKCQSEHKSQKIRSQILASGNYAGHSVKTIKAILVELLGHKCQICNLSEWMGKPILLIMDHIDGNFLNTETKNLRLLCSNCDAQLPTYKKKNNGKGRFVRKQNYRSDKSH